VVALVRLLARGQIFFWATAWLMVLLVAGTLAQAHIGLYAAQRQYFASWVAWLGGLPVPGGALTLAVLSLHLVVVLGFTTRWCWRRAGVLLTHVGTLALFVGGFVTAATSASGTLTLGPGETSSTVRDDVAVELAVLDSAADDHVDVVAFGEGLLRDGQELRVASLPFALRVERYARDLTVAQGRARLALTVVGGPHDAARVELTQGGVSERTIRAGGRVYTLALRARQYELPFALTLRVFRRDLHPGTSQVRAYRSALDLVDGDVSRPVVVTMNAPLRHRGYAIYQASSTGPPGGEATVLAVVDNDGRLFPYAASLLIALGLLVHLLQQLPRLLDRDPSRRVG